MGCDGGTIPTRDELVRTKKKPEQKDKNAELVAKWKHCAITQETLRQPIMACELGKLYNKESVLEFLLDRSKFEVARNFQHLRNLKDLKQLVLTDAPSTGQPKAEKGDGYIDVQAADYICPVVGIEMNGRYRFCYLWTCGCVFSERALKEVKSDVCHKCGLEYSADDVIILNGTEEDRERLQTRMEEKRLKAKLEKKVKKSQKHKVSATAVTEDSDGPSCSKVQKRETEPASGKSSSSQSAKSKLSNGLSEKLKPARSKPEEKTSIQKDSKTSSVYKSLFTSSDVAKSKPTAHWVTYNPCYY
ncbi:replication termination factor 2-like [Liolophura sinensis]|uniref:replication termination factor 2-like n=1 Tax=Liolophura sinensis TaxID=3198878 RepID=UPI00315898CB